MDFFENNFEWLLLNPPSNYLPTKDQATTSHKLSNPMTTNPLDHRPTNKILFKSLDNKKIFHRSQKKLTECKTM